MKKKLLSVLMAAVMVAGVGGVGAAQVKADDEKILGAGIYSASDNFNSYIGKAITNACDGIFKTNIEDGQNDQSTQNNQVDTIGSASNTTGNGYEMDAVAACVIGGVSLSGGVGSVGGIVIGVLMFTVINYGLAFIGVNMYWQYIVKGLIILLAVIIDMRKYAKRK